MHHPEGCKDSMDRSVLEKQSPSEPHTLRGTNPLSSALLLPQRIASILNSGGLARRMSLQHCHCLRDVATTWNTVMSQRMGPQTLVEGHPSRHDLLSCSDMLTVSKIFLGHKTDSQGPYSLTAAEFGTVWALPLGVTDCASLH